MQTGWWRDSPIGHTRGGKSLCGLPCILLAKQVSGTPHPTPCRLLEPLALSLLRLLEALFKDSNTCLQEDHRRSGRRGGMFLTPVVPKPGHVSPEGPGTAGDPCLFSSMVLRLPSESIFSNAVCSDKTWLFKACGYFKTASF